MVKHLLFLFLLTASYGVAQSQTYSFNFGTSEDSITSGSVTNPTFLPTPPDGANTYARVGSQGGKITVRNRNGFGSGSSMQIQAPTGGSVNKFSIFNMPNASSTFGIRFSFSVGDSNNSLLAPTNGQFFFFTGNGTTYSNTSGFSGSQVFSGLQLTCTSTGATIDYRNGSSWTNLPLLLVPYGTSTEIALYANNGSASVSYTGVDLLSHTLAAGTWDLYANGVFVTNLSKALLISDTAIRSFMLYGSNSSNNEANLLIDNIVYSNNIVASPLPLTLTYFDAVPQGGAVNLFWRTEVESDIDQYIVEHSTDGRTFSELAVVPAKRVNGTSYSFVHQQPKSNNFYRLKIHHPNGTSTYSQIVAARVGNVSSSGKMWYFDNSLHFSKHDNAELNIYELSGRRVIHRFARESDYSVDLSFLPPGVYIAHLSDGNETLVTKFVR